MDKEIIAQNISVLEELKEGDKLYVDPETLALSIDNRFFKPIRRSENRHECLIPILLTLIESSEDHFVLSRLETTYPNFKQLNCLKKLVSLYQENNKTVKTVKKKQCELLSDILSLTEENTNLKQIIDTHTERIQKQKKELTEKNRIIAQLRKVDKSVRVDHDFDERHNQMKKII
tara:strand:- start:475 stop:999 length:525 start_codon:yes stop_codon:yes gene_type:complete